jgi:hypothetical protein
MRLRSELSNALPALYELNKGKMRYLGRVLMQNIVPECGRIILQ